MYGTWLTWTQSHTEDVFVVATTNGVERLPAPALRKGRFSEIFFVDLPSMVERKSIFEIHLNKRGWNHEKFSIDTEVLAEKTPNRSGSEIEQIVIQGIINKVKKKGFGKDNPVETVDMLDSISSVRTMYELNPAESETIRAWAKSHNVLFAGLPDGENKKNKNSAKQMGTQESNKRIINIEEGEF